MPVPRGFRWSHRLILAAAVVALALTVVGLASVRLPAGVPNTTAAPRNVVPSPSKMFDHNPALLVVGDSYGSSYPDIVADKLGWSVSVDVQDGTGFVPHTDSPSPSHEPFSERLDRDAATYRVDYVLIDGGRDDLSAPPEQVVTAADQYVADVHVHWPHAKIIVVLPTFAVPDGSANYPAVADGLRRAADANGAYVIDPLAQRWYTDVEAKYLLGQDGHHLNGNGATYYGDKIAENLTQMFDSKPTLLVVGDSFAGGTGDPSVVAYPQLLARKEEWNLGLDAQGGTGFVHRVDNISPPRVPFIERLNGDAALYHYRVDYVLIDGGRSDFGDPPEQVLGAADEYIKKVRSLWPNAKIVVVLPSYVTRDTASNYLALAQGLRGSADSVGAQVIDPVTQGWYRDRDLKPFLWKDGVNLSGAGEAYYAGKIAENLTHRGVAP